MLGGAEDATGADPLVGQRSAQTQERVEYALDDPLGRSVVWAYEGSDLGIDLPAEHTLYGSGAPIVASTRGQLRLVAP